MPTNPIQDSRADLLEEGENDTDHTQGSHQLFILDSFN